MKELKYIIADNIKKYRKKNGITQMDLAEKAELSIETIKCIESGKRAMSLDSFLRIAHALETSPIILIHEKTEESPYIERFQTIIRDKNSKETEYLLSMLEYMAMGIEKYL